MVQKPTEKTATPVMEKPAAPVMEKPAAPVMEKPVAPVMEKPTAPVMEKPTAPVMSREWNKTKKVSENQVADRYKDTLFDDLMAHFTLPDLGSESEMAKQRALVKKWALKKMGELFRAYKNRLWATYKAEKKPPVFENYLAKQEHNWEEFVKYKQSEEAVNLSKKNKKNASEKKYHHHTGRGGYEVAMPKWDAQEAEMERNGITPEPMREGWDFRARNWFLAHGCEYDMKTGNIVESDSRVRVPREKWIQVTADIKAGKLKFAPDREKDLLTLVLGARHHLVLGHHQVVGHHQVSSSGGRASCLSTAAASANSVRRGDPCRSTAAPSVPSASGSQIVPVVNVEDDAEIGDQSPEDDEDELMFPELVDRCSKQAMEDQYMEDIAFGARFDETDDEEKNENDDSLVLADYEGEDLPTIEWNREDPQLAKGTVFQTMMDYRNAITTYHILTKNNYEVIKSEPDQAGAENAEENEAAIQLEIEAAVQHEEIEAANAEEIEAANAEEIEAAVQHEEIEAANAEEIEAAVQHEEIEPMDREQREQMDVERLQPMSPEEREQYDRDCLDSCKAMLDANFEELMAEEKAQASAEEEEQERGQKEGRHR
ncbi:hypothetical protein QYE76_031736 [Lolium multiflorum]|uniref:Uncharacterized protein n=1 Tax=Lolium multiflorum TaxID=4521 RepID=A0AAD8QS89_LOLMU|nr:hypothetical protein QYE76_031736 [Lolium multiflorum]